MWMKNIQTLSLYFLLEYKFDDTAIESGISHVMAYYNTIVVIAMTVKPNQLSANVFCMSTYNCRCLSHHTRNYLVEYGTAVHSKSHHMADCYHTVRTACVLLFVMFLSRVVHACLSEWLSAHHDTQSQYNNIDTRECHRSVESRRAVCGKQPIRSVSSTISRPRIHRVYAIYAPVPRESRLIRAVCCHWAWKFYFSLSSEVEWFSRKHFKNIKNMWAAFKSLAVCIPSSSFRHTDTNTHVQYTQPRIVPHIVGVSHADFPFFPFVFVGFLVLSC